MNNQRSYAGIIFEVWEGERSWYWFVMDPHCDGGAIGVAASETAAVRDACASIDEMTARIDAAPMTERCWEISLANLERYLTCVCDAAA
jgi:hypothetical protein